MICLDLLTGRLYYNCCLETVQQLKLNNRINYLLSCWKNRSIDWLHKTRKQIMNTASCSGCLCIGLC